jgi:hypothetical protein
LDTPAAGDLAHAGGVKALGQKDPTGALDDLTPLGAVLVGDDRSHSLNLRCHCRLLSFLPCISKGAAMRKIID